MDKLIVGIIVIGLILVCVLLEKIRKTEWWNHRGLRQTLKFGSATAKMDIILLLQDSETKADILALIHSLRDPTTRTTAISVIKKMKPFALQTLRKALRSEKNTEIQAIISEIINELEKKYAEKG